MEKKVERDGLQVIARKHSPICNKKLDDAKRQELKTIFLQGARAAGYQTDRWTSRIVVALIRKKWNVDDSFSNVRRMFRTFGLSFQKPDVNRS